MQKCMKKIERIVDNNDARNYIAAVKSEAIALVKTVQSQNQAQITNSVDNLVPVPASMPASFLANNHITANASLVALSPPISTIHQSAPQPCQHSLPIQQQSPSIDPVSVLLRTEDVPESSACSCPITPPPVFQTYTAYYLTPDQFLFLCGLAERRKSANVIFIQNYLHAHNGVDANHSNYADRNNNNSSNSNSNSNGKG